MLIIFSSFATSSAVLPFESFAFILKPRLCSNRTTGLFPCSTATCSIVFPFSSNLVRSAPLLQSSLINDFPPLSNTNFQLFLPSMMISADFKSSRWKTRIASDADVCRPFLISSTKNSSNLKIEMYSFKHSEQDADPTKCYKTSSR